jgi:hypothetical protein
VLSGRGRCRDGYTGHPGVQLEYPYTSLLPTTLPQIILDIRYFQIGYLSLATKEFTLAAVSVHEAV